MRFTPLVILCGTAAAVAIGCSNPGFRGKAGAAGKLRYAMSTDITTLDPAKVQDVDTMDILTNVFEGLVSYDQNNDLVGQLAESWKSSDGGKKWNFILRSGASFHNGRRVVASDVKWSFDRACSKALASPTAANYMGDIVGVAEVVEGKATEISGIRVVSEKEIEFTLDQPRAYFLGKLTYPCCFVLCKEAVGEKPLTTASQAAGTGPFQVQRIVPTQLIELKRYASYYNGAALLDGIQRPIIADAATRLSKFRAGELDTLILQRQDLDGIRKDTSLQNQVRFIDRPAVYYLGLNQGKVPALKSEKVRRAIAMAIDRKRIVKDLLNDLPEATGLISPGVLGHRNEYKGIAYDPEAAKKLLAEAGYPGGKGFPAIPIAFRDQTPDNRIAVEAIESQLRINLGITIKTQVMPWGAMLKARNADELSMYFNSWFADYADPQNFLSFLFTSDSALNHDGFSSPEFDAICRQADASTDAMKRKLLYQQAESLLVEKAVRIPLWYGRDAQLVSPRVAGIRKNILGVMPHLKTTVKE